MANAFISGRRYPTGGGAAIPAGHQSYTANGTFTAPYTGVYTVVLTAGRRANGSGGGGGDRGEDAGAGGGAGGGAYIAMSPGIVCVRLDAGETVAITVSANLCSFGSYATFATGTAPGNGQSGDSGYGDGPHYGGAGGAGGGAPTWSVPANTKVLYSVVPNLPSYSLTGKDGNDSTGSRGGDGGRPSNDFGLAGVAGRGGSGRSGSGNYRGNTGLAYVVPAAAGRIDITWGNQ